jgi:dihydropyrimidinase
MARRAALNALAAAVLACACACCSCAAAAESYVLITVRALRLGSRSGLAERPPDTRASPPPRNNKQHQPQQGGTVVNYDHSELADVLIVGDKIARVGPPGTVALPAADAGAADHASSSSSASWPPSIKRIDARGKLVIPGGVDPHTHLAMPFMGHVACDDFYGGHRAALAGGTTWHIDFALPSAEAPAGKGGGGEGGGGGEDDAAGAAMRRGYAEWRAKAEGKAVMDYSFHMAVTAWSDGVARAMEELSRPENGVNSFKFFMVRA